VKIDLYNHVMPRRYLEMMQQLSKDQGMIKRMSGLRMLWDIEVRAQIHQYLRPPYRAEQARQAS